MARHVPDKPRTEWGRGIEPLRCSMVEANVRPGCRVLDYGCGQGAYVRYLTAKGIDCLGLDLFEYPDWHVIAGEFSIDTGQIFRQVSGDHLPFADNEFDTVFSFEVLEHCTNPGRTLQELKRVTNKALILSVPDCSTDHLLRRHSLAFAHWTDTSHLNFFTVDSLVQLVSEQGLKIKHVSSAYRIDLNACFWDHLRVPRWMKEMGQTAVRRLGLMPAYYSSILLHAEKNDE